MALLSILQLILLFTGVQKGKTVTIRFSDYTRVLLAMLLSAAAVIAALYINIVLAAVICGLLFLLVLREKDWRYYTAVLTAGIALYLLLRFVMRVRF